MFPFDDMIMSAIPILRRSYIKLEQLERLRSENTPRRPMITHTIDSYQIPCHNKTKSKLQI